LLKYFHENCNTSCWQRYKNELTNEIPKPLLKFKGKTLLQHKLEKLPQNTKEIIIVIGYLGEKIKGNLGDEFNGIPIKYVVQNEMLGTAHALWQCREVLDEPFMVLMGDDLYEKDDLVELSKSKNWSILAFESESKINAGKVIVDENNIFQEIVEDFEGAIPYTLIYTGACYLTPEIFEKDMIQLSNGEYGLPQTISLFRKEKKINVLKTENWIRITGPEDLK
jgi:NDP-sugar pyrophosphorylase family protein